MVHCRKYNRKIAFKPDEKCKNYSKSCVGCPQPREAIKSIKAPKPFAECVGCQEPNQEEPETCETCMANGYYIHV